VKITSGKIEGAQKVLVYGPEGIGKSTFAAQFPNPLFIDVEGSTKHMDVRRLDAPESWTMLLEEVTFVRLNPDVCSTLVIDTADWAEQLCIHHVCAKAQKDGIEDFGYGKGYTYLAEEFGKLLNLLTEVVDRGVNVVLTAHAAVRKFEQPDEAAPYDRWELKLGKKSAPLIKEWADAVLFVNYKTFVVKDEKTKKATAQGGKRVMLTTHHPAWDAKNRWGLDDELPLEFASIAAHVPEQKSAQAEAAPGAVQVVDVSEKASDVPAEAPSVSPEPASVPDEPKGQVVEMPLHLAKLHQLMKTADVDESQIRKVVADKGYFPEATTLDKYPADFVEGVLVGAWPQVLTFINESRQTSLDVPSN
jgi:hypothetical protein